MNEGNDNYQKKRKKRKKILKVTVWGDGKLEVLKVLLGSKSWML